MSIRPRQTASLRCTLREGGFLEIATNLLNRGANVDQATNFGFTPLHAACEKGHMEAIALLLDRGGSDVNQATEDGLTSLHAASGFGCTAVVRFLLERGADPTATTHSSGVAPLHLAVELANVDVMQLLIDRRPWRRNIDGFLSWNLPSTRKRPAFHDVEGIRRRVWSFLRLPEPADVNSADLQGHTALMRAAHGGTVDGFTVDDQPRPDARAYIDAVRFLVSNGARLDMRNSQGRTALQIAESESSLLDVRGEQLMRGVLQSMMANLDMS